MAQRFHNDLGLYQLCQGLQKIVEFKDFSRLLSDIPVLFKADLTEDFSRKPSKFKYFSSLCEPCKFDIYSTTKETHQLLFWAIMEQ